MYTNDKMRPVETIPGIGGGGQRRMMEGINSAVFYCKNFVNVILYPQNNNKK
jgi:hypothetical protein